MKTALPLLLASGLALSGVVSAQEWAKARLDASPRQLEWVTVKHGDREVKAFLALPQTQQKATAVVVIHEIFGLTDWVRGVADQLAEAGYVAIAPDLLSGMAPGGGGTAEFGEGSGVRQAVSSLPKEQVSADLDAIAKHVTSSPACNGKVVVVGFGWGGRQSFRFATNNQDIKAAFVFCGNGPESAEAIARITCPVYGFYGDENTRVTATIRRSRELMKAAGKVYRTAIYDGVGARFMLIGEKPAASSADREAREEAWQRWKEILSTL